MDPYLITSYVIKITLKNVPIFPGQYTKEQVSELLGSIYPSIKPIRKIGLISKFMNNSLLIILKLFANQSSFLNNSREKKIKDLSHNTLGDMPHFEQLQ